MEHSPSREANRSSASQEIRRIFCNSDVHYLIQKVPSTVLILSQMNPVYALHRTWRLILILSSHLLQLRLLLYFMYSYIIWIAGAMWGPSGWDWKWDYSAYTRILWLFVFICDKNNLDLIILLSLVFYIPSISVEAFIISGANVCPPHPLLVSDGVQYCQPSCQDCAQLRISFKFTIAKILLQRWNQAITSSHLNNCFAIITISVWGAVSFEIWAQLTYCMVDTRTCCTYSRTTYLVPLFGVLNSHLYSRSIPVKFRPEEIQHCTTYTNCTDDEECLTL